VDKINPVLLNAAVALYIVLEVVVIIYVSYRATR
jgi:hypothetical protein